LVASRKRTPRWAERAEIWGELEDRDEPTTPGSRRRSSTLPRHTESSPLLPTKRSLTGGPGGEESGPSTESTPRKLTRRRRKSTGFPGLVARKHQRNRSSTETGTLNNILSLSWFRNTNRQPSQASTTDGFPWGITPQQEGTEARGDAAV
jgi:hypothetical protein